MSKDINTGAVTLPSGKKLRETGVAVGVLDALTRATVDEHYGMLQHYGYEHYDLDWYGYGAILHNPLSCWAKYWSPVIEFEKFHDEIVPAHLDDDLPVQIMAYRLSQLGETPCSLPSTIQ